MRLFLALAVIGLAVSGFSFTASERSRSDHGSLRASRADRVLYCLVDDAPHSPATASTAAWHVTASGAAGPGCPGYRPLPKDTPISLLLPTPVAVSIPYARVGDSVICEGRGNSSLRTKVTTASRFRMNTVLALDVQHLAHGGVRVRCRFR